MEDKRIEDNFEYIYNYLDKAYGINLSDAVNDYPLDESSKNIEDELSWITEFANNDYFRQNIQNESFIDKSMIRELSRDDVTNPYFVKWLFQEDEFKDDKPEEFNFDILIHNNQNNFVYGFFINNKLEGFIRLHKIDNNVFDISMLFVNKNMHNKGIGQTLFNFILQEFGKYKLSLSVFTWNKKAVYIYEKYGFKIITTKTTEDGSKMYEMERTPDTSFNEATITSDKNGVNRKKLYIAFIEYAKSINGKNTFGSLFDKDVFKKTYPFIPDELRFFYRISNPVLCVLKDDLTFFQVSELEKINTDNPDISKLFIFAATKEYLVVFNIQDKKIYKALEEEKNIKLQNVLSNTFDLYIQSMIGKGDILSGKVTEEDKQKEEEHKDEKIVEEKFIPYNNLFKK